MAEVWRRLQSLLPPGRRRSALLLASESLAAGLLEAVMLVLVVGAALAVANDGSAARLSLPLVGTFELDAGPALGIAGVAGLIALLLHIDTARLTAGLSAEVLRRARDRAVTAFAAASWARQAEEREGSLQETVSTLAVQTSALVVFFACLVAAAIGLAALFLAALVVDPVVTLVVLVFGALLFLALRPIGRLTRKRANEFVGANSSFSEGVTQWGSLAMELRVFGVERAEAVRLIESNRATAGALTRARFVSRAGASLYRDLAVLFLVVAVAALNFLADADLAAVGAVVLLIIRSLSYAQQIQTWMQQVNEQSPNLDALIARLEALEAASVTFGDRLVDAVAPIELSAVGYDYAPGRPGIDGVTLHVAAGEVVGVVGPSGGGKSTLVQVLLRLRLPTRGTVTVAGMRYEEISSESWHRLVALVPQEPKLFQGTVADNIAFLRPGITQGELEAAAASAHVLDEIMRLPQGFDTELGPRGSGLSGGQKQRVAIARALVGQPQLLVLDEPTSALDVRSEELLQETISELKGRVTMVIVAHRLTTLSVCNRVIGMQDGRVTVIGTLDEALAHISLARRVDAVPDAQQRGVGTPG